MRFMILMLCFVVIRPTSALSFMDSEHGKKLAKEAKSARVLAAESNAGLNPLQLFASPLQPSGGKFMCSLNWGNVLRLVCPKLAEKWNKGRTLAERYVDNLVETDDEVVEFRNDPSPNRNWKAQLKALKERKRLEYFAHVAGMAL